MKKGSIISIALMFVSVLITQNVIAGIEGDEYNNVLNYRYHEPILIDGNNNYTLTNGVISGSGTIFDPYLIMGWSINDSNNNGITINNTDLYFIIRDCKIMNCKSGIYFNNVKNGIIEFNNIKNNYFGIRFNRNSCNNNVISNNTIDLNNKSGILFDHLGGGHHSNNKIKNNNISSNKIGINTITSEYNEIEYNAFHSNEEYAIKFEMCMGGGQYNTAHHNNFIDNALGKDRQAANPGGVNFWNSSDEGNYWNDWVAPDNDSDGIVDEPYSLLKNYINQTWYNDYYPLVQPLQESGCKTRPNRSPAIILTICSKEGSDPLTLNFSCECNDFDGYIKKYNWNFGDGTTSENREPTHTYVKQGNYTIQLTITDNDGNEDNDIFFINVNSTKENNL